MWFAAPSAGPPVKTEEELAAREEALHGDRAVGSQDKSDIAQANNGSQGTDQQQSQV